MVRTATLVLRNGASISIETVAPATKPVMLSVVRKRKRMFLSIDRVLGGGGRFFLFLNPFFVSSSKNKKPTNSSQDPSVHPRWTGDASAVASEDGRLAKFARKFEGGVVSTTGGGGGGAKKGEKKK